MLIGNQNDQFEFIHLLNLIIASPSSSDFQHLLFVLTLDVDDLASYFMKKIDEIKREHSQIQPPYFCVLYNSNSCILSSVRI